MDCISANAARRAAPLTPDHARQAEPSTPITGAARRFKAEHAAHIVMRVAPSAQGQAPPWPCGAAHGRETDRSPTNSQYVPSRGRGQEYTRVQLPSDRAHTASMHALASPSLYFSWPMSNRGPIAIRLPTPRDSWFRANSSSETRQRRRRGGFMAFASSAALPRRRLGGWRCGSALVNGPTISCIPAHGQQ